MQVTSRIIRFLWFTSLLGLLAFDLYSYSGMPAKVGFLFNADGLPIEFMEKQVFFFGMLGMALALNLAIIGLFKSILIFPFKRMNTNSLHWIHDTKTNADFFKSWVEAWGYGFLVFININLGYSLYVIWKMNVTMGIRITDFIDVFYLSGAMVLVLPIIQILQWVSIQQKYNPKTA